MSDKSERHVRAGKANLLANGFSNCPECGSRLETDHFTKIGQAGGRASVEAGINGGKMTMRQRRQQPGAGRQKNKDIHEVRRRKQDLLKD